MNFILMKFGYPPVVIKTEDKDNYFFALQQADGGTIEPFINYIATKLVRSLEIMIAGAKGESIEEPDDIDKQIALLEQRLKANGRRLEIARTKEVLLGVYDDSITRLWDKFLQACGKFDRFYLKTESRLYVNHFQHSNQPDAIKVMRDKVNGDVEMLLLEYSYDGFNRSGFDPFNYKSIIQIDLSLAQGYNISVINDNYLFNKRYGEQLNESEISGILNLISRNHKDLIEQKMNGK